MIALNPLSWQKALFADRLNRFELMKIRPVVPTDGKIIRVSRNHSFEQVASILPPFLAFWGGQADIAIGGYDDSLALPSSPATAEVVWLDFDRYGQLDTDQLIAWLVGRLQGLRESSPAPLVIANAPGDSERRRTLNDWLDTWSKTTPGTAILDLAALAERLGSRFYDERRTSLTGTRLSDASCLEAARMLGLQILPDLLAPPIKAIAIDLDHTLYSGVLGEDGPLGVLLTEAHRKLQDLLCSLADRGILLAIVSRNEREDVETLFRERSDFPLQPHHILSWQVSWGSKAAAIRKAAAELRIGTDAFLFLDDNLGELTAVQSDLPEVKMIFAGFSPEETTAALLRFPALWRSKRSETDAIRVADLKANTERDTLAQRLDPLDYLKSLGVTLTFALDPREDLGRLHEISTKTNQFNLSLARLSELQIANYLEASDRHVVHVRLADRLSDSGSIGALYARREADTLVIEELSISCRAMGRMLENIIVTEALRHLMETMRCKTIRFIHRVGPRNQPALCWLGAYAQTPISDAPSMLDLPWSGDYVDQFVTAMPVRIVWVT